MYMQKLIQKSRTKSCQLDSWPTWLLKSCVNTICPVLTKIVNKSLSAGQFPSFHKNAVIRPLLKKAGLDQNDLKNYCPVSNLTYLSKMIERAVSVRLDSFMEENHLNEPMQSAYKANHSTETALIKVHSDIIQAIEEDRIMLLVLLDLSSAFDTVDHDILIQRMATSFGIRGAALAWLRSYLTDRSQCVAIDDSISRQQSLGLWGSTRIRFGTQNIL